MSAHRKKPRLIAGLFVMGSALCFLGATGCGGPSGPQMSLVRGRVTQAGQPVTTGSVDFYPTQGRSARGVIASDGSYTLTTNEPGDGAIVGTHTVTVKSTQVISNIYQPKSMADEIAYFSQPANASATPITSEVKWIVPEIYSRVETSGLRYEVQPGVENIINIELP